MKREPHGESRNRTWSPRLHSPGFKSSALSSNCSLRPPRLSSVFESRRPTMDYYLCMQVLLKRPICEQRPFPRCPNRKIAPQLLFAEPVTVRGAAAELPAVPGLLLRAPPSADSAARPSLRCCLLRPPGKARRPPSLVGLPPASLRLKEPSFPFRIHWSMKTESMDGVVWQAC